MSENIEGSMQPFTSSRSSAILVSGDALTFCPSCRVTVPIESVVGPNGKWAHCSVTWVIEGVVRCPNPQCRKEVAFEPGLLRCPSCGSAWALGIPLISARANWPLLVRLVNRSTIEEERDRTHGEYRALWESWAADCLGVAAVDPPDDGTRYSWSLRRCIDGHRARIRGFSDDVSKFMYSTELKLAKREFEYSWKYQEALDREVNSLLDGITAGVSIIPDSCSIRFSARTSSFLGEAYSRSFLRQIILSDFAAYRTRPRPEFQMTLDYARRLNGVEFEQWLCRLLRDSGLSQAVTTQVSRDQGADIIVNLGSRRAAIQAKQYSNTVGNDAVQQVLAAMQFYRCTDGWVVTTSTFSRDAVDLAARTGIQLIDGPRLLELPRLLAEFGAKVQVFEMPVSTPPSVAPANSGQDLPADLPRANPAPFEQGSDFQMPTQPLPASPPNFVPVAELQIEKPTHSLARPAALGVVIALIVGVGWLFFGSAAAEPEIRSLLNRWQTTADSQSLGAHLSCYAPTVSPFFNARALSREQVEQEKRKLLAQYPVMEIEISSLSFEKLESRSAVVRFEKAWNARGVEGTFEGAETARLRLVKVSGKWLISGEEELQVHWYKKHRAK